MTLVASEGNADGHGIKQLSPAPAPVQQLQSARCEAVHAVRFLGLLQANSCCSLVMNTESKAGIGLMEAM